MSHDSSSHPVHTFCRAVGVRFPIVQGGMTFGSDGRLVAAVSEAGALGTLGTFHYRTYEKVMEQVAIIREATKRPFSVNVPFFEQSFALVQRLAREGGVRTFTLGGWFSEDMAKLKAELGLTVLVSVNAPTVARMIEGRPYDALIVQGNESGGANSHYGTEQLFELVRPIARQDAPILWAGGQWDGGDLMRAVVRGAAGVQLGTRFFFADESPLHPSIKAQVIDSNAKRPLATALTPVNDTLSMRFITNKAFKTAQKEGEIEKIFQDKERVFSLSKAFFEENAKPLLIYAGTGVYKLREVQSCRAIVEGMVAEYNELIALKLPAL